MIQKEKCIVMDIDGTLCPIKKSDEEYIDLQPKEDVLDTLRSYHANGFYIILSTSRNMRTFEGNVGQILANTAKTLFAWLDKHDIPYNELHFGKPWAGRGGFYVDDRTIRPGEFTDLDYDEIMKLLAD